MAKHNVNISLGTEAYEKWLKMPQGTRSAFVEKSLGAYKEDSNPKGLTDLIFLNKSTNTPLKQKKSSGQENKSYETAATTHANKKKNSSNYQKGSTTRLLSNL